MANLTQGRITIRHGDHTLVEQPDFPIEAAKQTYNGCMAGLNAAGNMVDGGDGGCTKVIGVADGSNDNTSGTAGALRQQLRRGAHWFDNSTANPVVAASTYLTTMKAEDNHTICVAAGTGVAIAGRILRLGTAAEGKSGQVLIEFF